MTLAGTRPILQDELLKYELHHRARIAIKPGITGMWQVSGRSDITDFEEVVRLDVCFNKIHRSWSICSCTNHDGVKLCSLYRYTAVCIILSEYKNDNILSGDYFTFSKHGSTVFMDKFNKLLLAQCI